ncbi:hypothetical protein GCM10011380_15140 [Sphingomonas metalli]|uniref:DUF2306 domain-containing protein n=1 Tax=Sphingomonas metalli TaxID=1779358 RepID=A0A916T0J6_9SPHN|nr:DUF2306 domain-containing protein [Sphingomonas metalli]GGB26587.1 hypothetical protein GCM10011380_15140 [Sphingomonas metalli]
MATLPHPQARPRLDSPLSLLPTALIAAGAVLVASLSSYALARYAFGVAPAVPTLKTLAVAIHLAAVLPAIPLGLYVLLTRKGGARHRMLGKIWMALMLVTAGSALFIRNLNGGRFSVLHLFVLLIAITLWRAIAAARAGNITAHRRQLIGMFVGALILPGLFAFLPGRTMWQLAFG